VCSLEYDRKIGLSPSVCNVSRQITKGVDGAFHPSHFRCIDPRQNKREIPFCGSAYCERREEEPVEESFQIRITAVFVPFAFKQGRIEVEIQQRTRLALKNEIAAHQRRCAYRPDIDARSKIGSRHSKCAHECVIGPSAPGLVDSALQQSKELCERIEPQSVG
jgi:hypothetical protein